MATMKVQLPITRAGETREAELVPGDNGEVAVMIPSVGSHRICKFEVEPTELMKAMAMLTAGGS
jgi:hypothetical protein